MIITFVIGAFCLGVGWVSAGFRKKDNLPKKKMAIFSVIMILAFSVCMFLTPLGGIAVNVGDWIADMARGGGLKTVLGTVVIILFAAALGFLIAGVIRDISKDKTPDGPTYWACMTVWLVAGLTLGAVGGPIAYQDFTSEITNATSTVSSGRQ